MIELRTLGVVDLRIEGHPAQRPVVTQPKRLALLAYLAAAPLGASRRRDLVLAMFWPEHDAERGRAALRQATHVLRRTLGDDVIETRGDGELSASPFHISCDAPRFRAAIAAGRDEEALDLYRGDFLPGLYVSDAPAFDEWVDADRRELRDLAVAAAGRLAARDDAAGLASATHWARRAAAWAPTDERVAARLMSLLAKYGDRAGALEAYERHARRIADELEVAPSPDMQRAAAALRETHTVDLPPAIAIRERSGRAEDPAPRAAAAGSPPILWPVAIAAGVLIVAGSLFVGRIGLAGGTASGITPAPPTRFAGQQLVARRFYEEAQRELALGRSSAAQRLLRTAVMEDSAFALAAWALSRITEGEESRQLTKRAMALADSSTDEERLEVRTRWAFEHDEPARLAYAETLAIRYPHNGSGRLLMGRALVGAGRFQDAIPYLRSVIAMDSAGLSGRDPRCEGCEAYSELMSAYELLDSLPAAVRVGEEWAARQPRSPRPWGKIAYAQACMRRYEDALRSLRAMSDRMREGDLEDPIPRVEVLLRAGDYETADAILLDRLRNASPEGRESARFLYWISLRDQGRYREALALARVMRADAAQDDPHRPSPMLQDAMPVALTLLEMNRPRESAALFDSIAQLTFAPTSRARSARAHVGNLTYASNGWAAAADTAKLSALADSLRHVGARSAYARDQRMHHYVRGLLLRERGNHAAAYAEFRRALYSPLGGYVRTNLELGRAALRTGRLREAAYILEAGARGPVAASGTHAPKTELYLLLGEAHERMGDRPAAVGAYRRVLDAWKGADKEWQVRRHAVEDRLRRLER